MSRYLLLLILVATLGFLGCSGSDEVAFGGSQPLTPAATAGNVIITHKLSRAVHPTATSYVFTGRNAAGRVLYGPVRRAGNSRHLLVEVPVNVTNLQVDYQHQQGQVLAATSVAVVVPPGGTTTVSAELAEAPALTVELVNDSQKADQSKRSDSDVYMLLSGSALTMTGALANLTTPQGSNQSLTASSLSSLGTPTNTLISPYTGNNVSVYQFSVSNLVSGRLFVSLDKPLVYANNSAPTLTGEKLRYDKMEFGYPSSGADLTSLDFYAVPLQFEYFDSTGNLVDRRSYYSSTPSILQALYNLDGANMPASFQTTNATVGWNPNRDSLATFGRALGPQTITGAAAPLASPTSTPIPPGSAYPYPSFKSYLDSLVASGNSFISTGDNGVSAPAPQNNNMAYNYSGRFLSDGARGYVVALTGTTANASENTAGGPYGLYTVQNSETNLSGITYASGQYVAVGDAGTIRTSPDNLNPGVAWVPQVSQSVRDLTGVTFGNNQFVVSGFGGTILTSPDAVNWTAQNSTSNLTLRGVAFGANQYAAVGEAGTILTSPNGTSWTQPTSSTNQTLNAVAGSSGQLVAVGQGGTILSSSDGVTWIPQTSSTTNALNGVAFLNNQFLAVGQNGTILTSPNGSAWTAQNSTVTAALTSASFGNGTYLATGASGAVLTSSDGVTWTPQIAATGQTLRSAAYGSALPAGSRQFIAVGQLGSTLTSPNGLSYTSQTSGTGTTTLFTLLPANLPVNLNLPAGSLDDNIYSASANSFTAGQSSNPGAPGYLAPDLARFTKNSVYANIAGDLISGVQCGYCNGRWGNDGRNWYSNPPVPFPFGGARTTNDGFYNPFAAVFYNLSDAYGFPFSDRGGRPSPYVPMGSNVAKLRITVLPDFRLDAPQAIVTAVPSNPNALNVQWTPVTTPVAATGYNVTVVGPGGSTQAVNASATQLTLSGLSPATPYTVAVQAVGVGAGNVPIQSYTVPAYGTTSGNVIPSSGPIQFSIGLNNASGLPNLQFSINGGAFTTPTNSSLSASVAANLGTNFISLRVQSLTNQTATPVFEGLYQVPTTSASPPAPGASPYPSGSQFYNVVNPTLSQHPSGAVTIAGGPLTPPFIYNDTGASAYSLSLGTTFAPTATKQAFLVKFP